MIEPASENQSEGPLPLADNVVVTPAAFSEEERFHGTPDPLLLLLLLPQNSHESTNRPKKVLGQEIVSMSLLAK